MLVEVWMVKGGMEEIDVLTVGKVGMEIDGRAFFLPLSRPPCFQ